MKTKKHEDRERKRFREWMDKDDNWKSNGKKIHHHIVNKYNGGNDCQCNLLYMDEAREKAWHFLFKNLSFEEAAELLLRVARAKKNQERHQ